MRVTQSKANAQHACLQLDECGGSNLPTCVGPRFPSPSPAVYTVPTGEEGGGRQLGLDITPRYR